MPTRTAPENIKLYPDDTADRTDRFCSEMQLHDSIDDAFAYWDEHVKQLEIARQERLARRVLEG